MLKNSEVDLSLYVKKHIFVTSVILSLVIGFVGGTIYSSFKLAGQGSAQQVGGNSTGKEPQEAANKQSMEFASQILKLETFLQQNPEDAEAWTKLGNLFFDSKQPANAIQAYEKSLLLAPDKLGVMTDLGVMYRRNDQPQKAIEMFDRVIALDPNFEQARFNKGVVLLHDLNDFDGGITAWEELVKINPMAATSSGETVDDLIKRMKQNR
ncbi:MAG: tetratricopeptide repeat protein [Pseudomonadota bacterium]